MQNRDSFENKLNSRVAI